MRAVNKKMIGILFLLVLSTLLLYGCGQSQDSNNGVQENAPSKATFQSISAEELKAKIDTDKNLLVVDVREQEEYDQGHIQGTLLIPMGAVPNRIGELPKEKDIVLVCASGARSSQVAQFLVEQGYLKVFNLEGGISAWSYGLVK